MWHVPRLANRPKDTENTPHSLMSYGYKVQSQPSMSCQSFQMKSEITEGHSQRCFWFWWFRLDSHAWNGWNLRFRGKRFRWWEWWLSQAYIVADLQIGQCQGTLVVVLTWANIHVSALNKGGSGDPSTWSAVSCTAWGQAVSGIYIRDHRSYYLWIVTLLA
jgi:hypothetical protein